MTQSPPVFDSAFLTAFTDLVAWRRDVRRFRTAPAPDIRRLIELAALAPSVGNSQPWRFVEIRTPDYRRAVAADFERCNAEALTRYDGAKAEKYARLKLEGLNEAPIHLAVFCDQQTGVGHGLGRQTMPETLAYSVVMAIHTFWLAARAQGIGVGWVSILDPQRIKTLLGVSSAWTLIAYLCVGYPLEEHTDPELVRHDWQQRVPLDSILSIR